MADESEGHALAVWTKRVGIFTGLLFVTSLASDYIIWRDLQGKEREQSFSNEQQKAFFSIGTAVQVMGAVDKEQKPTFGAFAQWQNVGGTRTKWTTGWTSVQYFSDKVPNNFDISKSKDSFDSQIRAIVGPNTVLQTAPVAITHDELAQAETGKGVLLIWGAIDYADLFQPEITHHGSFCQKMVPSGQAVNPANKQVVTLFQPQPYKNYCNVAN